MHEPIAPSPRLTIPIFRAIETVLRQIIVRIIFTPAWHVSDGFNNPVTNIDSLFQHYQ